MPVGLGIALGVIGLVFVTKRLMFRRRCAGLAYAGCGAGWAGHGAGCRGDAEGEGHPHRGPWGRRWRGPGQSWWLRGVFAKLDTTPGQEREIRAAVEEFQTTAWASREALKGAKSDIGRAIAGETFDDTAVAEAGARFEATTELVRDAFTAALKRVHAVLDEKQRGRLAELLEKERPFGGPGHPYRG